MPKAIIFSGQPVFSQLVKLMPRELIHRLASEHRSDYYRKKFTTWDHLLVMLFAAFCKAQGLRELTSGMVGFSSRLMGTGMRHIAPRSTLSDANARRPWEVFEAIFKATYARLRHFLPDSSNRNEEWIDKLLLIDSTTITLFKEILKAAGRSPADGKRKGGVKVHVGMKLSEDVPSLVRITSSASHDVNFLNHLGRLSQGTILVFDKAYVNFKLFQEWSNNGVFWVTRLRSRNCIQGIHCTLLEEGSKSSGVLKDELVSMGFEYNKNKVTCRIVTYHDKDLKREFEFITNDLERAPELIALFYKQRWQIELLFKRLKQNLRFDTFLGDNENAIRIQIWCNLLADLLMAVVRAKAKRLMAFSNVAGLIRIHLMNYVDIHKLIKNPIDARIFAENDNSLYQMRLDFG